MFSYQRGEDNEPALTIVEAVSWVTDTPVLDLEPLHYAIETDDLNGLFGDRPEQGVLYRSSSEPAGADQTTSFRYAGVTVSVTPEEIRIDEG